MGVVVAFDPKAWAALFPEFNATVSATQATALFAEATVYCRNDGGGPVNTAAIQTTLLNLLTAHLAQIQYGSSIQANSPLVGAITDATEGSVSVTVSNGDVKNDLESWYKQTKYGNRYWVASAPYRKFHRYHPGPPSAPVIAPWGRYGGW